ncbi:MAG: ribonuclease HII [Kiritimatiellaceae bacterium]|nr:ribonuclease HII [Kiritimatiellaceae bacterium]
MDMLRYEKEAWNSGLFFIAGIDEAGRGPLAGPVVAAAVAFERGPLENGGAEIFSGLTDSKALSEKRREHFFERLQGCSFARIGCAVIGPEIIDDINILQATWKAMAEAVAQISPRPDLALVDGRPVRGLCCKSQSIVKGDAQSLSIAAASVIAKVTRDRLMVELDARFPEYGFAKHKGYGTKEHLAAIRCHGPCPHHRKTFRPVSDFGQGELEL